jgi:hypothetical protein
MAQNRTMNFYGYAYGNTPVSLTANINGVTVFNGTVNTVDQPLPEPSVDINDAPVLFTAPDTTGLFPIDFAGAYPMSIEVTGGYGIAVKNTYCNYMNYSKSLVEAANSSIEGTTLTLGNVISGNLSQATRTDRWVTGNGVQPNTFTTSISTDGKTVSVTPSQTVVDSTITVVSANLPGNALPFVDCYNGIPSNSEGTPDSRSSVTIDGVAQVPPNPVSQGQWTWIVPTGSTLAYAFNVSLGNVEVS